MHPCFNVCEAGGEGGVSGSGDSLGGEVELGIICIAMELEVVVTKDLSKW